MPTPQQRPQAAPDFIPAEAPDFIPADGNAPSATTSQPMAAPPNALGGMAKDAQDWYDDKVAPIPENERGTTMAGRMLDVGRNAGRGVMDMAAPLFHPVETMRAASHLLDPMGPGSQNPIQGMASGVVKDFRDNGAEQAIPHLMGQTAGAYLTGKMADAPVGTSLRNSAAMLDNAMIATPSEATEYGADPGRALSSNRIAGWDAAKLNAGIKRLIPGVADENRAILAAAPSNRFINTAPLVSDPFDSLVSAKTNPDTGVAPPMQVAKARGTQRVLTHVQDDVTGKPTPMMRNPMLTPLQTAELKSNIYGMTDYDNPSQAALSNSGLKGAAHNLKLSVENAVPESIESGQRLHDLMSAKDILEPRARLVKLPTSKAGLIDRGIMRAGTGVAANMDRLGSGIQQVGDATRFMRAPAIYPTPFVNRPQK